MQNKFLQISLVVLFSFGISEIKAQTSINATGGDATSSGGSVSYSIGQVFLTTNSGTNGSIAHGVQQPYEISVITSLEEAKDIQLTVSAYPNPTTDYLTLSIDASTPLSIQSMSYQLYDMNGKLLQSEKITSNQTSIAMSNLVTANYVLKVIQENKEIKTFKIIKH